MPGRTIGRALGLHPSGKTMASELGISRVVAEANKVAEETNRATADIPLLNGRLITGISLSVARSVDHGLNGTPRGWLLVDKSATGDVWRVSWDERTITLDAGAATTVAIWVFR